MQPDSKATVPGEKKQLPLTVSLASYPALDVSSAKDIGTLLGTAGSLCAKFGLPAPGPGVADVCMNWAKEMTSRLFIRLRGFVLQTKRQLCDEHNGKEMWRTLLFFNVPTASSSSSISVTMETLRKSLKTTSSVLYPASTTYYHRKRAEQLLLFWETYRALCRQSSFKLIKQYEYERRPRDYFETMTDTITWDTLWTHPHAASLPWNARILFSEFQEIAILFKGKQAAGSVADRDRRIAQSISNAGLRGGAETWSLSIIRTITARCVADLVRAEIAHSLREALSVGAGAAVHIQEQCIAAKARIGDWAKTAPDSPVPEFPARQSLGKIISDLSGAVDRYMTQVETWRVAPLRGKNPSLTGDAMLFAAEETLFTATKVSMLEIKTRTENLERWSASARVDDTKQPEANASDPSKIDGIVIDIFAGLRSELIDPPLSVGTVGDLYSILTAQLRAIAPVSTGAIEGGLRRLGEISLEIQAQIDGSVLATDMQAVAYRSIPFDHRRELMQSLFGEMWHREYIPMIQTLILDFSPQDADDGDAAKMRDHRAAWLDGGSGAAHVEKIKQLRANLGMYSSVLNRKDNSGLVEGGEGVYERAVRRILVRYRALEMSIKRTRQLVTLQNPSVDSLVRHIRSLIPEIITKKGNDQRKLLSLMYPMTDEKLPTPVYAVVDHALRSGTSEEFGELQLSETAQISCATLMLSYPQFRPRVASLTQTESVKIERTLVLLSGSERSLLPAQPADPDVSTLIAVSNSLADDTKLHSVFYNDAKELSVKLGNPLPPLPEALSQAILKNRDAHLPSLERLDYGVRTCLTAFRAVQQSPSLGLSSFAERCRAALSARILLPLLMPFYSL